MFLGLWVVWVAVVDLVLVSGFSCWLRWWEGCSDGFWLDWLISCLAVCFRLLGLFRLDCCVVCILVCELLLFGVGLWWLL